MSEPVATIIAGMVGLMAAVGIVWAIIEYVVKSIRR